MRGHGALLAAMDTTVHVENKNAVRIATIAKTNDGGEGECLTFTLQGIELHSDPETGQITRAPVVLPVEGGRQMAAKEGRVTRLPKAAQIALRALAEAIDEQGTAAPASAHIPARVKVVSVSVWRQQAYLRGISTSDDARARQLAFKRASEHLNGAGCVGMWDRLVWLSAPSLGRTAV